MLRLALPSKGELEDPTLLFLKSCGLPVGRSSSRSYTGQLGSLKEVSVIFQRAADIPLKVQEGSADLGITGLDVVSETLSEDGACAVLLSSLGYGDCDLVVAVPDVWIDVTHMVDLAELAVEMRENGRELRVATKYPRLVQRFLLENGVSYFNLVASTGAIEVAPVMGFADVVADLSSSGQTLRDNGLRVLTEGTVLRSQACLVGNMARLAGDETKLQATKVLLELMEARLRAGRFYSLTANIRGASEEEVGRYLTAFPDVAGLQGPTIAPVYSRRGEETNNWYAVTVVVPVEALLSAVEHLRCLGGNGITVSSPAYVFEGESEAYKRLLSALGRSPE